MSDFSCLGLYVWDDDISQHAFWKACGVNTLQFCDLSWYRRAPDVRDIYLRQKAQDIETAHRDGFQVYVILFANISQWEGEQELCDTPIGYKFFPDDAPTMQKRLEGLRHVIRTLRHADGFTFFAGDPGGVPAELGQGTVMQWVDMAKKVAAIAREEAPHAAFHINPWAVTMWQYPLLPCEDVAWWQKETELTEEILQLPELLGPQVGIELPCHNYYRAMALRLFSQAGEEPKKVPDAATVQRLQAADTLHVWGWPYFLLDEADDGDVGPDGSINPLPQSETRYIHRFVGQMRQLGMQGLIGNWSYVGHKAKALNTYAFGRFCRDAAATPDAVIDEFAACIATEQTAPILAQVLRFIENQSNWQRKLPPEQRLQPFSCAYQTAAQAAEAFAAVLPRNGQTPFATAEEPAEYLQRVECRLQQMLAAS